VVVVLLSLMGCKEKPEVAVVLVGRGSVEETVAGVNSGTVEAEQLAELAFGAVGRVREVNVHLGERVPKGMILAQIEHGDRPTSGSYSIRNTPTESLSDDDRAKLRNRTMGFVFQSFHLLPRSSALRNVMMPFVYASSYEEPIAQGEQRERAERALVTVGLGDRMNHLPNQLSGGQRQRVAIARAIVNNPRVLFADEPTGNLDSKVGGEIVALFERLNGGGVTVVMVTHDPSIAQRAIRRLILGDGRLIGDSRGV